MGQVCSRRSGVEAQVCALGFVLLGLLLTRPVSAAQPYTLVETEDEPGVVVYPAQAPGARRVTVLLHGMCGEPANACRHFAPRVTIDEHLICPRASQRCAGGGSTWPERGSQQLVEAAVQRALVTLGPDVDETRGRTLIGYSLGAFRALELAERGAGRYPRVMLIGAKISPHLQRLQASGVERLLLSAGSWDMTHDHMRREAGRLSRRGFSAQFLGLGPVGHALTPRFAEYLPQALSWLRASGGVS